MVSSVLTVWDSWEQLKIGPYYVIDMSADGTSVRLTGASSTEAPLPHWQIRSLPELSLLLALTGSVGHATDSVGAQRGLAARLVSCCRPVLPMVQGPLRGTQPLLW